MDKIKKFANVRFDAFMVNEFIGIDGKRHGNWTKIGAAFLNNDSSINVILDAYPKDGKIQLRRVVKHAVTQAPAASQAPMSQPKTVKDYQSCPSCGAPVQHAEGCAKCVSCTWAVCG